MPPRVSLTMIVRDAAGTLGRCLGSVADLVDEIVVVDTGSTDATGDLASRYRAKVVEQPWSDSFAAARNASLDHATGTWAFWLDADEWLDETNRTRLSSLFARLADEPVVYLMRQDSPLAGGPAAGMVSVAQARLFRNDPSVRWRHRVHEQILPACLLRGDRPCSTGIAIAHSGFAAEDAAPLKDARNRRLALLERDEGPADPWVLLQLGKLDLAERFDEAEQALLTALAITADHDPLRRQILGVLACGYRTHGNLARALEVTREGLGAFPNDTHLLNEQASLALDRGDLATAERAFESLLLRPADPDEQLGGVDFSWRNWQARHNLAAILLRQGRLGEAEAHWRVALRDQPDAAHLWLGLAEVYLAGSRWDALEETLSSLERSALASPAARDDLQLLRARSHLARNDQAQARPLLDDLIDRQPEAIVPRLLLVRADLIAGDIEAAEAGLHDVLRIDPEHAEARRSLAALEKALGGDGEP